MKFFFGLDDRLGLVSGYAYDRVFFFPIAVDCLPRRREGGLVTP